MTGLEVAYQARGGCHIVFVTAYDAYAVSAFETGALDYVLKLSECERLRTGRGPCWGQRVREYRRSGSLCWEKGCRSIVK